MIEMQPAESQEGLEDTGWVVLTLSAGISAGSPVPSYRRIGDHVYLRGQVLALVPESVQEIFALPAVIKPTEDGRFPIYRTSSAVSSLLIEPAYDRARMRPLGGSTAYIDCNYLVN